MWMLNGLRTCAKSASSCLAQNVGEITHISLNQAFREIAGTVATFSVSHLLLLEIIHSGITDYRNQLWLVGCPINALSTKSQEKPLVHIERSSSRDMPIINSLPSRSQPFCNWLIFLAACTVRDGPSAPFSFGGRSNNIVVAERVIDFKLSKNEGEILHLL